MLRCNPTTKLRVVGRCVRCARRGKWANYPTIPLPPLCDERKLMLRRDDWRLGADAAQVRHSFLPSLT